MSDKIIEKMLENDILNEETRAEVKSAWEDSLASARETIRGEIREEFASRYEHDKQVMVESLDRMVTESLQTELLAVKKDKELLAADRVKFKKYVTESKNKIKSFIAESLVGELKEFKNDRNLKNLAIKKLNTFVSTQLKEELSDFLKDRVQLNEQKAKVRGYLKNVINERLTKEIGEFRKDRKLHELAIKKLDRMVNAHLREEISEFAIDRTALVETKHLVIDRAKQKLEEVEQKFIKKSTKLVQEFVSSNLHGEMKQLKEDIQIARENMFGRRLFEAFAGEFSVTHLSENKEIKKLTSLVESKNSQLREMQQITEKTKQLVEKKEREFKSLKDSVTRERIVHKLVSPLGKQKGAVMEELLSNVPMNRIEESYEKYLPAVLTESEIKLSTGASASKQRIVEDGIVHSVITGDRKAANVKGVVDDTADLKRLAGLN